VSNGLWVLIGVMAVLYTLMLATFVQAAREESRTRREQVERRLRQWVG